MSAGAGFPALVGGNGPGSVGEGGWVA